MRERHSERYTETETEREGERVTYLYTETKEDSIE